MSEFRSWLQFHPDSGTPIGLPVADYASVSDYALFVSYFPHLVAGPILHHSEMLTQFRNPVTTDVARNLASGLLIFAIAGNVAVLGYFKYYDFFVSSSQNLLSVVGLDVPVEVRSIVLPGQRA